MKDDPRMDVTGRVDVTDPAAVEAAVRPIFRARYPARAYAPVARAFEDVGLLFRGEYPGYRACETPYHDLRHSLDMTLATARLLDGYERGQPRGRLGAGRFAMALISGLFHDAGYIRHRKDSRARHGAEYTLTHVGRSARFLAGYLPRVGMPDYAGVASRIVHFTGYERPMARLRLYNQHDHLLGRVLATADLLAQIADPHYLEKCRDRLYLEFEIAGLTRRKGDDGADNVIFSSPRDMLEKTPGFIRFVRDKFDGPLEGAYHYAEAHFGGRNPYIEAMDRTLAYLEGVLARGDARLLAGPLVAH